MIATATGNTCSDTGKITINVESVFVVAGPGMSVCMGEQIILNAGPSATNYSFNWNGPSGYNSGLQDPVISSANIADQGVYTVTLTDNTTGCYSQDTTQISVVTSATLTNVTPNQTIKYGSTVQLNADNVLYYWWTPADGSISNPNINNPLAAPTVSTTYIVYGMDANGCRDTASVTIDVTNDTLFIPSAFTPNGDGLNDVFRVGNLGHYKVVEMSIYNRWGTMIYHVNDGSNRGWDGTYNGVPQETGVFYYYVIISQPDGIQRSFKGDVTLIR
jgi:gliding motility-associated-like protein